MFYSNKTYGKLENVLNCSLNKIANWLRANKLTLTFNISKCDKGTAPIHIYIDKSELEQKDHAKYLGVFFDKRLCWKKHIEYTNIKLSRRIGILRKVRQYVQESSIKNIYNSFLKPYTEYGKLAWCETPKCHLTKIKEILNKSARTALFKGKYESSKPLYKYLKILPLTETIKHNQGKFLWKPVNNQQPKCLQEKFPLKINEAINNPNNNKMIIPYRKTTTGKRSLSYEGYKLWNLEIPE